jgi:hypothetical protein
MCFERLFGNQYWERNCNTIHNGCHYIWFLCHEDTQSEAQKSKFRLSSFLKESLLFILYIQIHFAGPRICLAPHHFAGSTTAYFTLWDSEDTVHFKSFEICSLIRSHLVSILLFYCIQICSLVLSIFIWGEISNWAIAYPINALNFLVYSFLILSKAICGLYFEYSCWLVNIPVWQHQNLSCDQFYKFSM